jgi:hypothetical protein
MIVQKCLIRSNRRRKGETLGEKGEGIKPLSIPKGNHKVPPNLILSYYA